MADENAYQRFRALDLPVIAGRRFRGAIEVLIAFSTWGILAAVAAGFRSVYVERAHIVEVLHAATVIKQELTLVYSNSGDWPAAVSLPNLISADEVRKGIESVDYQAGAFTFNLTRKDRTYRVGFRAAVSAQDPRAPVLWLCGYAQAPAGYRVSGVNRTDIPRLFLPSACRGGR